MRTFGLIVSFYKSYAFSSLAITVVCMYFPYMFGLGTFSMLFWFKVMTLGMIFYLNNSYKKNEYYYYRNLGVSKKLLWGWTLSFDLIFYLVLFILTLQLKCYIPLK